MGGGGAQVKRGGGRQMPAGRKYEEVAIASKASAIHVFESVCLFVCPKHQKTKPIYKYVICLKSSEGLTASMHKF